MTETFETILDPRATAPAHETPQARRAPEAQPLGRGIPEVTRPRSRLALPAMILGATLVTGGFVYSVSRAGESEPQLETIAVSAPAPTPPGVDADAMALASAPPAANASNAGRGSAAVVADQSLEARQAQARAAERLRSPLLIGDDNSGTVSATRVTAADGDDALAGMGVPSGNVTAVRARVLANQGALIAQGTLVPGVLETAINSDLPGLLRAVVAADVASFDGRSVLIPRGSRLIGQYKSGIAIGQTRAFVVWSRLITPAGVSIDLGSPGTDALGRAGLSGQVDEHFLQRFGAALLLSVVGSAGQVAANAASNGDNLTINAAGDASRVAELALQNRVNIPPTIKVRQGTPIRIFVAHDLDFGGTELASVGG